MVCKSVWEENPRALAIDLSPVQTQTHAPACICTLCVARYLAFNIGISMKGVIAKVDSFKYFPGGIITPTSVNSQSPYTWYLL